MSRYPYRAPVAPFTASHYNGKPCVYDTTARVVYTGFRTMQAARDRAAELNRESNQNQESKSNQDRNWYQG